MKTMQDKQAILNVLHTTGGNMVYDDTTNKKWGICAEGTIKTADPLTLITPLFDYGDVVAYHSEDSAAEVAKACIFGLSAANGEETIAASTRYSVEIRNPNVKRNGFKGTVDKYSYTSAAALTGTAATDRYNVYYALNSKINAFAGNNVTSYLLSKVAFTGGTDGTGTETDITFGETGTQETSAATVAVAKIIITSGTLAGDDAAGTIWVYSLSGTWSSSSKTLTMGTSAIVVTTAAALTEGQGLVVIDDAAYYQSIGRGGITEFAPVAGFSTATSVIARAGVYSLGVGSVMSKMVATYNREKDDVQNYGVDGADFLNLNDDVDTSLTYTRYTFRIQKKVPMALKGEIETSYNFVLYVSDLDTSSELTEFNTALVAVLKKQGVGALS